MPGDLPRPRGADRRRRAAAPASARTRQGATDDTAAVGALLRSAAEQGGHSRLIARAMAEPEAELWLVRKDTEPTVVAEHVQGPAPLVAGGKVLVLMAGEAGLACISSRLAG